MRKHPVLYWLAVSFSTEMFAQTSQTKGGAEQQEAAQAAPPSPRTWKVACSSKQVGLDCRALQTLFLKNTGQPVLTVAVHVLRHQEANDALFSAARVLHPRGEFRSSSARTQLRAARSKLR